MKYGMIVDCVFPHQILEQCLMSILGTAKPDKIFLVEDSFVPEEHCRSVAETFGLGYIKSTGPRWQENNFALPEFFDCDYLIVTHSDVNFSATPTWFDDLKSGWENADPDVVALNMSVDAFRYYNGMPVYYWRQMPGDKQYGVAIDMHVQTRPLEEARLRLARLSPVSSFRMDFLKEVYPLEVDFDCELFLKITLAKKWSLWLNNAPIQHLMGEHGGADTDIMIRHIHEGNYSNEEYFAPLHRVQAEFKEKYGTELYDYLYHDFGTRYRMAPETVIHANNKTLAELNPKLDQVRADILNKTVPSYEYLYA